MAAGDDHEREVRRAGLALRIALVLAVASLGVALLLRYRPDIAARLMSAAGLTHPAWLPKEPAPAELGLGPSSAADSSDLTIPAHPESAPASAALSVTTTARTASSRRRRPVVTDVVLLPCSTPNPRPDGSFIIPPHDPTHRTIVGLPSGPGEPKRGLVIPPHDPAAENRIPVELIPLDSVLEHTIRIPPHNPDSFTRVRRD
ncbi:MAG TPA: hypothetical protein VFU46_08240, partial [Gemmatimonadales bacterium]|nr:hypothetical protein [Gemmatimonadales bacterium]